MANLTLGFAGFGSLQTTLNPNCETQFSTQQDAMNTQYYQNPSAALLNHSEFAIGNQAFESQMNEQLPPSYGWEDQNPSCDSLPNPLERLLEGVDREILAYCSWLDGRNSTN